MGLNIKKFKIFSFNSRVLLFCDSKQWILRQQSYRLYEYESLCHKCWDLKIVLNSPNVGELDYY